MFRLPLATSLVLCSPAFAEIVRFDVEAHCNEIAGAGGTYSSEMYNFCVRQEQTAYNSLKARWDAISSNVRAHCTQVASFGGPGSYEMLSFCVEQEEQAAASKPTFKY
ncbi:hypothetical protein [Chachezhania sediminis]|uniref:hypothetical protein n=1 Tax=Chachezhania sediminis TaxID=2599291 RepID=UPI00131A796F|nr:hypothetical protein [Chachezhania sediminis]